MPRMNSINKAIGEQWFEHAFLLIIPNPFLKVPVGETMDNILFEDKRTMHPATCLKAQAQQHDRKHEKARLASQRVESTTQTPKTRDWWK